MNYNLFKRFVILLIAVVSITDVNGQARKRANRDTEDFRYEIECVSVGAEGTYLIKVWTYSKKPKIAIEQSKKNAVHGVIFKGFSGGGAGCTQKPLASSPSLEDEKADFFDNLFDKGYLKYVNAAGDGSVNAEDRLKVGREYKIGVVVSVMKDALRKDMEAAGVIKGLSSGF